MRLLSWIVMIPIAIVIVAFSVSNRAPAMLDFWPFPWILEAPVYLVVLAALVIGFACGMTISWLSNAALRRRARASERQAQVVERELALLRDKAGKPEPVKASGDGTQGVPVPVPVSSNAA